jgi:hypothetical protein
LKFSYELILSQIASYSHFREEAEFCFTWGFGPLIEPFRSNEGGGVSYRFGDLLPSDLLSHLAEPSQHLEGCWSADGSLFSGVAVRIF